MLCSPNFVYYSNCTVKAGMLDVMNCCLVTVQDDHEEEEDKTQTNHVDSQVDYTDVYCRGTLLNSV